MCLTLADVTAQLNAVMPDDLVREQAENINDGWSSNERLAQFVANVALSLHNSFSPDEASLERIAVNLENASNYLALASRRLRRLTEEQ